MGAYYRRYIPAIVVFLALYWLFDFESFAYVLLLVIWLHIWHPDDP